MDYYSTVLSRVLYLFDLFIQANQQEESGRKMDLISIKKNHTLLPNWICLGQLYLYSLKSCWVFKIITVVAAHSEREKNRKRTKRVSAKAEVARQLVVTIWSQPFDRLAFDRRQFGRIITLIVNWGFWGFSGVFTFGGLGGEAPDCGKWGVQGAKPPTCGFDLRLDCLRSNARRPNCCDQIVYDQLS